MTTDRGDIGRRRLGDRRMRPRFEIVGALFGTLETVLRLPLRNVGLTGALLESHMPLEVDSVHRVTWNADGRDTSAQVRIVHVRAVTEADGERTYLIGVEFQAASPQLTEQLQQWLLQGSSQGEVHGA